MKTSIAFASLLSLFVCAAPRAQLAKDVTLEPFYDVNKAGLSFTLDKQSVSGMYEIPGKPQHFLVLGFWGFVWTLYPDTTKTYAPGAVKDYKKKQVADFNNVVMKYWEQGATGAAFDPWFSQNHYLYIIYNKYRTAAEYHRGTAPNQGGKDGFDVAGLVVVERWKLSSDYASLTRDTTIFVAEHYVGVGSSNMTFGKDGLLYISTDSYSQNGWDSTIYMRKILRIDVRQPEGNKLYTIPSDNPFYNAANPAVKKEIYAYGFRNTYAIQGDFLTGSIWGAEVGEGVWEEINIIKPGKNYGWGNGGDISAVGPNSIGIEGPCSPTNGGFTSNSSDTANTNNAAQQTPFSRVWHGKTYTCADFTNGTWNFAHSGNDSYGSKTALPGTGISCIIVSQAFRGDPSSPLYGYHFVTDVAANYFIAVKEGTAAATMVGGWQAGLEEFSGDKSHNGITSFAEDSYGNMYVTALSSSGSGAYAYHDIYRMKSPSMKALDTPRGQVHPVALHAPEGELRYQERGGRVSGDLFGFIANGQGKDWIRLPQGRNAAAFYGMDGKLIWTGRGQAGSSLSLPPTVGAGTLWVRFLP